MKRDLQRRAAWHFAESYLSKKWESYNELRTSEVTILIFYSIHNENMALIVGSNAHTDEKKVRMDRRWLILCRSMPFLLEPAFQKLSLIGQMCFVGSMNVYLLAT